MNFQKVILIISIIFLKGLNKTFLVVRMIITVQCARDGTQDWERCAAQSSEVIHID